jgi:O-methyltransferase
MMNGVVQGSAVMDGHSDGNHTRTMNDRPVSPAGLYLDLLKKCLTRAIFGERYALTPIGQHERALYAVFRKLFAPLEVELVTRAQVDLDRRQEGGDWPVEAETMIGMRRLDHLQTCIEDVLQRGVPGDLIETGVWRGGASIFMRAVLKAYGDTRRTVWVADSFEGLPKPDSATFPLDAGYDYSEFSQLAVSLDQVKANFARYDVLDQQVRFLRGWFRDTLPVAPIDRLAILRLDGDLYESTMEGLEFLYPKLSVGGYVIIDDYESAPPCAPAVHDYRARHGITEPIERTGIWGAYWQRRQA